jgi:hypothetical protein
MSYDKRPRPAAIRALHRRYRREGSLQALATEQGVHRNSIANWFRGLGLEVHVRGGSRPKPGGPAVPVAWQPRYFLRDLASVVLGAGGTFTRPESTHRSQRIALRCAAGHAFTRTVEALMKGSWCPTCAKAGHIQRARLLAEQKQGACLTERWSSAKSPMRWRCGNGHEFTQSWDGVLHGLWCPSCCGYVGEETARRICETLLGVPFPRTRPDWLRNDRGQRMELDGYNEQLGIAFEHQGRHHYQVVGKSGWASAKHLQRRQADDRRKQEVCRQRGILLIDVEAIPERWSVAEAIRRIRERIVGAGFDLARTQPLLPEEVQAVRPVLLAQCQADAARRGGRLLSPCVARLDESVQWHCGNPHHPPWRQSPRVIRKGHWCRHCEVESKRPPPYDVVRCRHCHRRRSFHHFPVTELGWLAVDGRRRGWHCTDCPPLVLTDPPTPLAEEQKGNA